jgi:Na+-driven multidrug efflux pump
VGDIEAMAGIGMGNALIGSFCMAFCYGLNGTLESKISQAFGAEDFEGCGQWLNRSRIINTLIMIPIAILFLSSGYLLKLIG